MEEKIRINKLRSVAHVPINLNVLKNPEIGPYELGVYASISACEQLNVNWEDILNEIRPTEFDRINKAIKLLIDKKFLRGE